MYVDAEGDRELVGRLRTQARKQLLETSTETREVRFAARPPDALRRALLRHGWRYDPGAQTWSGGSLTAELEAAIRDARGVVTVRDREGKR